MTAGWFLVDVAVRATAILAVTLLTAGLLRRRSAAVKHWVLAVGVAGTMLMPAAMAVVPGWNASALFALEAVVTPATDDSPPSAGGSPRIDTAVSVRRPDDAVAAPGRWANLATIIAGVWMTGAAIGLLVLAVGLLRLVRLSRRSPVVTDPAWRAEADAIARRYGLTRGPRLVRSAHPSLLVAWGARRPTIIVPDAASRWTADRIRIVLAHELAHVARADWITLIGAEVVRALHWFNPLAWIVARRLRHESERACDDAVLGIGTDACHYATHLVGVARELRARPLGLPAPAMAVPSSLERRIVAMMNATIDRTRPSRTLRVLAVASVAALTMALGSAETRSQAATSSIAGRVTDQTEGVMPGVEIEISNAAGDVVASGYTSVSGRFELSGLRSGTYALAATMTGFKKLVRTGIEVGPAQIAEQDLMLEIGGLEETFTISGGGQPTGSSAGSLGTVDANAQELLAQVQDQIDRCASRGPSVAPPPGVVRVGGSIRPPRKLISVNPIYPADLAGQGIGGVVILEGRIAEDGTVEDMRILRDPNPGLSQAAVDAATQWRFTPTLLNGCPVPVVMTVTMSFEAK